MHSCLPTHRGRVPGPAVPTRARWLTRLEMAGIFRVVIDVN